jgi:hypothetical protein
VIVVTSVCERQRLLQRIARRLWLSNCRRKQRQHCLTCVFSVAAGPSSIERLAGSFSHYWHGGGDPFAHTILVPGGTTIVFCAGGGGLLLLKLRQPARAKGSKSTNADKRMNISSCGF